MTRVFVHGLGAVSPAGWGVPSLRAALAENKPLPTTPLERPGRAQLLSVRPVPPPSKRPEFLAHPRLRRASSITQHVVTAVLEALGRDAPYVQSGSLRLGVVVCMLAGCVTYSRRLCEEIFKDPALASPLLFPETVFNAPASHLAAYLKTGAINYTLVGDEVSFAQGLVLAAGWLLDGIADGCVVVGGEELDWIVADAMRLFQRQAIHSSGAGAIYLKCGTPSAERGVELACVTDSFPFTTKAGRIAASRKTREQLRTSQIRSDRNAQELLYLGSEGREPGDLAELAAWQDWSGPLLAPKKILGEAFAASAAWQCVASCDALRSGKFSAANVSVVGVNQQVIGVRFGAPGYSSNP